MRAPMARPEDLKFLKLKVLTFRIYCKQLTGLLTSENPSGRLDKLIRL